jgi:hypothetical protein
VTRPGLLFLALLALAACATSTVESIPPGYSLDDPTDGIVIVRTEKLSSEGSPLDVPYERQQMRWTHEETGEAVLVAAENDGPLANFYVSLPAGHYRLVLTTRLGGTERWYVLRFHVEPGALVYAGTIRFHASTDAPTFTLHDEFDAEVTRFRASHPELADQVHKSLVERWTCPGSGCTELPWAKEPR